MADSRTRIVITKVLDPGKLSTQIEPKVAAAGRAIGARMQRIVPKRTWALHDSIVAHEPTNEGGKISVEVSFGGGDVDYGMIVERGSSKQAAQPFARPALLQSRASDLKYSGNGPETRGVRRERARQRARDRREDRRTSERENREES